MNFDPQQKRRVADLLADNIPEDEAFLMKNGRCEFIRFTYAYLLNRHTPPPPPPPGMHVLCADIGRPLTPSLCSRFTELARRTTEVCRLKTFAVTGSDTITCISGNCSKINQHIMHVLCALPISNPPLSHCYMLKAVLACVCVCVCVHMLFPLRISLLSDLAVVNFPVVFFSL